MLQYLCTQDAILTCISCAFSSLRKADALLFFPLHVIVAPNPCAYHTLLQFSKTKMKHTDLHRAWWRAPFTSQHIQPPGGLSLFLSDMTILQ